VTSSLLHSPKADANARHASMKAYEIFQNLPLDRGMQILSDIRELEPNSFKATVLTLARDRKLRPVFIQKKPRDQQAAWCLKTLKLRTEDHVAEHILQVWLMKKHPDILVTFLDAVGIEHDGEGMIEGELPESIDQAMVKAGADAIFDKYDDADAALYLHVFQLQTEDGWPEIADLIANDKRAQISA